MKNYRILFLAVILVIVGFLVSFITGVELSSAGKHVTNYFASGDFALGVFSAGIFSAGIFAAGIFSVGIFSIGIFSIGIFSIGIFNIALSAVGIFVLAKRKVTLKDMYQDM